MERSGIRQLLMSMGSAPAVEDAPSCEVFDWHLSHYFTSAQLTLVQDAMKSFQKAAVENLFSLCQATCVIDSFEISQHYAGELLDTYTDGEAGYFFHGFGPTANKPQGILILEPAVARIWVQLLLGEAEESEAETPVSLSPLELTLLGDITAALLRSWQAVDETVAFLPMIDGIQEGLAVTWDRASHLCRMQFTLKTGEGDEGTLGTMILPCESVVPLAGRAVATATDMSLEQMRNAMVGVLHDYPVPLKVTLGSLRIRFQDVLSLRTEDILVLDHPIDEPLTVAVAGRPAFSAVPGKSNGKQAVLITAIDAADAVGA
ncbi:FliM/FliN family flagellar motor switch protein [Planctomycetota bacterium]